MLVCNSLPVEFPFHPAVILVCTCPLPLPRDPLPNDLMRRVQPGAKCIALMMMTTLFTQNIAAYGEFA